MNCSMHTWVVGVITEHVPLFIKGFQARMDCNGWYDQVG